MIYAVTRKKRYSYLMMMFMLHLQTSVVMMLGFRIIRYHSNSSADEILSSYLICLSVVSVRVVTS